MSTDHEDLDGNELDPASTTKDRKAAFAKLPTRERDYIVPAKDARGVSYRAICRCPPELVRVAVDVVASKKYPFRVQGDLYRWCIYAGAQLLAAGAGIKSTLAQVELLKDVLTEEESHAAFMEIFRRMKARVEYFLDLGHHAKARAMLSRLKNHIEGMPPGYWQDEYMTELLRRYGSLMDGATDLTTPRLTSGPVRVESSGPPRASLFGTIEDDDE